jgi:hypothetical protein
MILPSVKTAVIIGHPAHELRIYRFMELYKPQFYILTDGAGTTGRSRVAASKQIIENAGAKTSSVLGRFSDPEMYRIIREFDTKPLTDLLEEIVEDLVKNEIELIAGDAIEGFNPTHDLCRYLINAIIKIYNSRKRKQVQNFDFLLDGPPAAFNQEADNRDIILKLSAADFSRKISAAEGFLEIASEIKGAIERNGKDAFYYECLRPVQALDQFTGWSTDIPFYESFGLSRVQSGVYSQVISFEKHLLPLGRFLAKYSEKVCAK